MNMRRVVVGHLCYFILREDGKDKVIGIHDFYERNIFAFEGKHRHARQKVRQLNMVVSDASLERFERVYIIGGAEAWLDGVGEDKTIPAQLNIGSLTNPKIVHTAAVVFNGISEMIINEIVNTATSESGYTTIKMKVRD